jgi:hypothetical protein
MEGDCIEVDVTPNLKLLVVFSMSLEGICHELDTKFYNKHHIKLGASYF